VTPGGPARCLPAFRRFCAVARWEKHCCRAEADQKAIESKCQLRPNAVRTQSALVDTPAGLDLDDPALIQRAAGHFATSCAACHGAPGVRQSPVVLGMTPAPPRLEDKVGHWEDKGLFWIVKHGIKYSGMPAWSTQARDDEVWAQVAFLRALPGMTPQAYADLALGGGLGDDHTKAGGQTTAALNGIVANALADCARCHGQDGLGRGQGAFPIIAGQPEAYLYATLRAFGLGMRQSGFMAPPASRYSPEVLGELARHFASQPVQKAAPAGPGTEPPAAAPGRKDLLALGGRLALEGLPARKIPACQSCHGQAGQAKNPFYPYLAGQPEWYLAAHLKLWKLGQRGGTV